MEKKRKPSILVIEDSPFEADHVSKELLAKGYDVSHASSGSEGISKAIEGLPDLVLLDLVLPDKTGYDVCRTLRSHKKTAYIPVILVTVRGETEDKVIGLGVGANDYLTKPYDMSELLARVSACLRVKGDMDKLIQDREETLANLRVAKQMAMTDPVTGLFNRRYFNDILSQEFLRSQRYGSIFSCLMIDIDCFKQINDSFSHDMGDSVLCELSEVIKLQIRDVDLLSRFGGDEFAVLLPQSGSDRAYQVAERILHEVCEHSFSKLAGWEGKVAVSIGVSGLPNKHISQAFQVVASADLALLRAKKKGRNQIEVATDQDIVPLIPVL